MIGIVGIEFVIALFSFLLFGFVPVAVIFPTFILSDLNQLDESINQHDHLKSVYANEYANEKPSPAVTLVVPSAGRF